MVQKHVRQFFNCPTLQGAEVEDDLGPESMLVQSHWEQRLFEVGSHRQFLEKLAQKHVYTSATRKLLFQSALQRVSSTSNT
jgi:hypothetical protein